MKRSLSGLRQLFSFRPRNDEDYYHIGRWMIGKKFARFLLILLAVISVLCFVLLSPVRSGAVRTYRYNSLPLKFYTGTVQILAEDGHIAYIGEVRRGEVRGSGSLYDSEGNLVYSGEFERNQFSGRGTLYYAGGSVAYTGGFSENQFDGFGTRYRENGTVEYEGDWSAGEKNGTGILYDAAGSPVFSGSFHLDSIVFDSFVGRPAGECASLYTGKETIYTGSYGTCVAMQDIGAVYTLTDRESSLEGEWMVSGVCVASDRFPAESGSLTTVGELTAYFGSPRYLGSSWATLGEAVALNMADSREPVSIHCSSYFGDICEVSGFDNGYELFVYAYEKDGLRYSFFCSGSDEDGFLFYAIEAA